MPLPVQSKPGQGIIAVFVSLALIVCYVLLLPKGRMGAYLTLASLVVGFVTLNRSTLAVYLLLFGPMTFGAIATTLGFPGFGGKIAGGLGLLLFLTDSRFLTTKIHLKRSVLWTTWISLVLVLWYFIGPQTKYCQDLLVGYFINTLLTIAGFSYLLWKRSVNWWVLGQLAVVSSFAVLTFGAMIEPSLLPNHLLQFGVLLQKEMPIIGRFTVSTHDLAYMAALGGIMVAYASPDDPLPQNRMALSIAFMVLAALMLGWAFHRTSITAFVAAFAIAPLVRPKYRKRYKIFMALSFFSVAVIIGLAYADNLNCVTDVLETNRSVTSRLNRSTNWDAAFYLIGKNPWVGQGLGGYYIPGFSLPGQRTYAHNVFLGLLSDLGILGSGMIFIPLIPLLWRIRQDVSISLRGANGGAIVPVLIPAVLITMTSGDISSQCCFFVIIVLLAENWPKKQRKRQNQAAYA